jgi:glycerol uptake facilitator-like aquaporin
MAVFLVVFMAGGTTIVNTQINGDLTLMGLAIAGGIPVMLMIYAIGGISGAHMNPAVSLAFASKGVFPFAMVGTAHTTCLEPDFSIFYLIRFLPFATTRS